MVCLIFSILNRKSSNFSTPIAKVESKSRLKWRPPYLPCRAASGSVAPGPGTSTSSARMSSGTSWPGSWGSEGKNCSRNCSFFRIRRSMYPRQNRPRKIVQRWKILTKKKGFFNAGTNFKKIFKTFSKNVPNIFKKNFQKFSKKLFKKLFQKMLTKASGSSACKG